MNVDWNLLSFIGTEIQQARGYHEVTAIWHRYLAHLQKCRLIYSHQEESDIVLPSKHWPRNFPKGGFLRPLFAHDNLYFLSQRIAEEQWLGIVSPIKMDSTVEFDTNMASYVEGFVEGRQNSNTAKVREVLDFVIMGDRVNFGYNFYALENALGYYDGSRVPSIRRNLRAIMKLDHLDVTRYKTTGEVVATITDQELDVKADEKLHEFYDTTYREGMALEFLPINEMLYLLLLKTVEIEYSGKAKNLELKVAELYDFMHYELKTLFVREAIIALNYFKNRSKLTFFGKIGLKSKEKGLGLLKELRNMSWDLMLFRVMERIASLPGQGDFLLPYFLSFDKKMVQLFDLSPLRAILAYDNTAQVIPLWETPPLEALEKEIDITGIEQYFSQTFSNVRYADRRADPRPDFSELKERLEAEVVRLLTGFIHVVSLE